VFLGREFAAQLSFALACWLTTRTEKRFQFHRFIVTNPRRIFIGRLNRIFVNASKETSFLTQLPSDIFMPAKLTTPVN
jgi:hypothetical protein